MNWPCRLPVRFPTAREIARWIEEHPVRAASLGNWFYQACNILATALTLPFVLKHLSAYEVGLWLTFQSSLGIVNLTNFGLSFAISRQAAFAIGVRDTKAVQDKSDFVATSPGWDGISELYAASRVLFRFARLIAVLLIAVLFAVLVANGKVDRSALPVWMAMGTSFVINLDIQRFSSFLDGLGSMAYNRIVAAAGQLLWTGLAIGTLCVRPSLFLLALAVLFCSVIQLVSTRMLLGFVGSGLLDPKRAIPSGLVLDLLRVAYPVGVVISSAFFVSLIQVPFIGLFLGVNLVAPYYVAQRIGQVMFLVFNTLVASQLPRFTMELGAQDWTKAYVRMRFTLIISGTGALGVCLFYWLASPLVARLWLGPGHYVNSKILFFMAIDFALLGITVPWAWFTLASGRNPFMLSTLGNAIMNLALMAALVQRLGVVGLPIAGIISGLASNHLYNIFEGGKVLLNLRGKSLM